MKSQLRIEVEPLSDQRWVKIERSLLARVELEEGLDALAEPRPRRVGPRVWLAAAALLGAVAVLMFSLGGLSDRVTLDQPSRITTGATPSHLALPGLTLDVEPESAVVVSAETPQGMLVVLDRGGIVCQVASRSSQAPLIVQAGVARVRVVGTHFSVTRTGESARVEVHEGVVEVTAAGQSVRVRAGEQWPAELAAVGDGAPENEADPDPIGEAAANRGDAPGATGEDSRAAAPSLVRATREATQKAVPSEKAVTAQKAVATDRRRSVAGSPSVKSRRTVAQASSESALEDSIDEEWVDRTPRQSSQAVFEQATALERSDPARAAQLYRELESGGGSWAQNALYARGRLAASRGNAVEARRLLELYLQRFPHGSNAEDARAVLQKLR